MKIQDFLLFSAFKMPTKEITRCVKEGMLSHRSFDILVTGNLWKILVAYFKVMDQIDFKI